MSGRSDLDLSYEALMRRLSDGFTVEDSEEWRAKSALLAVLETCRSSLHPASDMEYLPPVSEWANEIFRDIANAFDMGEVAA